MHRRVENKDSCWNGAELVYAALAASGVPKRNMKKAIKKNKLQILE